MFRWQLALLSGSAKRDIRLRRLPHVCGSAIMTVCASIVFVVMVVAAVTAGAGWGYWNAGDEGTE